MSSIPLKLNEDKTWIEYNSNQLIEYFKLSDQISTFIDLHTVYNKDNKLNSLGFLLQKMPGCNENYLSQLFQAIENNKTWKGIKENDIAFNIDSIKLIFQEIECGVEFHVNKFIFYLILKEISC